tara:strand:+ start:272 stop:853 length:582 start_codon:yes stop_codon:yes gene_type:complete
MATYDDWVPIPPYEELKARVKIFQAEHTVVCKWEYWGWEAHANNCDNAEKALRQGCNPKQVAETQLMKNAVLRKHIEAHLVEKEQLEKLTFAAREDMWDHNYMAERGHPSSAKRKRHWRAHCEFQSAAYTRKWVYEHLPSDVRVQRRARALERWRKAAYLLGILAFWKHATNKDGSKAARAALERVSKRARVH